MKKFIRNTKNGFWCLWYRYCIHINFFVVAYIKLPNRRLIYDVCLRFITACAVVQAVVKATSQSNGKGQILTPWCSETLERISMKLGIYNRVAGISTRANPCGAATAWVVWANTWKNTCCGFLGVPFLNFFLLYSSALAKPAHVDRFWWSMRHTTCFRPRMCLLGSRSYCSPFSG